jgi:hypothetical protein
VSIASVQRAKKARAAAAKNARKPVARPSLGSYLPGHVVLELPISPAYVSADAAELVARGIKSRPGPHVAPLRPPVLIRVTCHYGAAGEAVGWLGKGWPLDFLPIVRVLVERGYVANAGHIALAIVAKRWGPLTGMRIYLRSLVGADDVGAEYPIPGQSLGQICPLPELAERDARTLALIAGEAPIGASQKSGGGGEFEAGSLNQPLEEEEKNNDRSHEEKSLAPDRRPRPRTRPASADRRRARARRAGDAREAVSR